jgi:hypothetical protein
MSSIASRHRRSLEKANDDDRECGNFGPGRFAWKRDEFRLFDQPIPYRGRQGFFNVPADLLRGYAVSRKCTAGD